MSALQGLSRYEPAPSTRSSPSRTPESTPDTVPNLSLDLVKDTPGVWDSKSEIPPTPPPKSESKLAKLASSRASSSRTKSSASYGISVGSNVTYPIVRPSSLSNAPFSSAASSHPSELSDASTITTGPGLGVSPSASSHIRQAINAALEFEKLEQEQQEKAKAEQIAPEPEDPPQEMDSAGQASRATGSTGSTSKNSSGKGEATLSQSTSKLGSKLSQKAKRAPHVMSSISTKPLPALPRQPSVSSLVQPATPTSAPPVPVIVPQSQSQPEASSSRGFPVKNQTESASSDISVKASNTPASNTSVSVPSGGPLRPLKDATAPSPINVNGSTSTGGPRSSKLALLAQAKAQRGSQTPSMLSTKLGSPPILPADRTEILTPIANGSSVTTAITTTYQSLYSLTDPRNPPVMPALDMVPLGNGPVVDTKQTKLAMKIKKAYEKHRSETVPMEEVLAAGINDSVGVDDLGDEMKLFEAPKPDKPSKSRASPSAFALLLVDNELTMNRSLGKHHAHKHRSKSKDKNKEKEKSTEQNKYRKEATSVNAAAEGDMTMSTDIHGGLNNESFPKNSEPERDSSSRRHRRDFSRDENDEDPELLSYIRSQRRSKSHAFSIPIPSFTSPNAFKFDEPSPDDIVFNARKGSTLAQQQRTSGTGSKLATGAGGQQKLKSSTPHHSSTVSNRGSAVTGSAQA